MPGLANLDAAIAGAIERTWQVPAGTMTAWWVMGLAPGEDPRAVVPAAARITPTPYLPDTYAVEFDAPQAVAAATGEFQGAAFYYPLLGHQQTPRFIPNDPLFKNEWHLRNVGQTGGLAGADAHVTPVWDHYTGTGVEIGIVDDGLQYAHPDLSPNYVAADSFDFSGNDFDPAPDVVWDFHGTSVAGVAAGRGNNGTGVSGAAPDASLAGLRLFTDDPNSPAPTDQDEADALSYHRDNIDIYSNSWGPADIGTLGSIGPLALAALQANSAAGRHGLGNIYSWAAGNGRQAKDNVNYDPYANSRFVIAVGAIDDRGKEASYSEPGAPMLVTAYSNSAGAPGITTTDLLGDGGYSAGDYTNDFGGTSSAAPLVSGVIALMLQANPNLTNRDVQNILVRSARKNDAGDPGWSRNAAGFHINHKYGFGAIDAKAAVALAETWEPVHPELSGQSPVVTVNKPIPDVGAAVSSSVVLDTNIKLEHVEVVFSATHPYRGDLEVVLTAPSGTRSVLATQHFADPGSNYTNWVFSTVRDWGELSAGKWTLTVRDRAAGDVGTFNNWQLRVYGADVPPVLSGLEATRLSVLENEPVALTGKLTVADADNPTLAGARVFVSGNFIPGEDVLTFTPQGAITGSYDAASGILTLSGPGTPAEYQAVLRSVRYTNSSDTPNTLVRAIGFRVTDVDGNVSNTASRTLAVVPVNDPPRFTVGPDITVAEDAGPQTFAPWATNVSGPEPGQSVSFTIVGNDNPALFSAQPFVRPDGALTFTSAPDANGTATIQVLARDNGGTANHGIDVSPEQTFRIIVTPVNDPATARNDDYTVLEDGSIRVPAPGVLANDRDPEGDALTATQLTSPQHGNLTFNSDGSFTYAPAPDFSGTDSFTYEAIESGGGLSSVPATVTLHVVPTNDPPTATDDTAASDGRQVTINVLANDTDPDGDVLRVGSYTRPAMGSVSRLGRSLVYTPLPGATGTDTFSYSAVDAAGVMATATVTVAVTDAVAPVVQSARATYGARTSDFAWAGRSVLSWANLTRFEFVFSEGVTVNPAALTLTGELGGPVPLTFGFDPATRTATWSSAAGLAIDRYTLRLSAAGVVDGSGNALHGDWAKAFAVLPGDFDGNGIVDDADLAGIRKNFSRPGRPVNRWADVNGDGVVGAADLDAAVPNEGKRV